MEDEKLKPKDKIAKESRPKTEKKESPIHDTAGGEMPDPNKEPSQTTFHTEIKTNL